MRLRRNAIVLHEAATSHFLAARVVRRVDETSVEVINTLGRVAVVPDDRLRPVDPAAVECLHRRDRSGRPPLVVRMPSLRRLKQHAAWYTPSVWADDRRSRRRRAHDAA